MTQKPLPDALRLFFALWPDAGASAALNKAAAAVIAGVSGKLVPSANWHVTLVFLGAVPRQRLTELHTVAAAIPFEPFELLFDRIEHWSRTGIFCFAAGAAPPAAKALVDRLRSALSGSGFKLDVKPWRPHITLARKVRRGLPVQPIEPLHWVARSFVLVESQTLPEGPRYSVHERYFSGQGADAEPFT